MSLHGLERRESPRKTFGETPNLNLKFPPSKDKRCHCQQLSDVKGWERDPLHETIRDR